jgi:putative ATP-binding cassette transporter
LWQQWSHDFFNAFEGHDGATLQVAALLCIGLAGLSISVTVMTVWSRMTLQREWRAWLTRHLMGRWLSGNQFHRLRFEAGEAEKPEYRIAEDVRVATDVPIGLAAGLLGATLGAVTFVGIYSVLLTLAMTLIARHMMRVIASRNVAEAQSRAIASKVREVGAQARPGQDGTKQHGAVLAAFEGVIRPWRALCHPWMRTTLISHGNTLAAPIVGWVPCAPKYLTGTMKPGEVAQAVSAFVMVQAVLHALDEIKERPLPAPTSRDEA